MNRALRRKVMKQSKGETLQRASEDILKELKEEQRRTINNGTIQIWFMDTALVLHRELKYGQQRCLKIMSAIDELAGEYLNDAPECIEKLHQLVKDEVGIDVKV